MDEAAHGADWDWMDDLMSTMDSFFISMLIDFQVPQSVDVHDGPRIEDGG